MGAAPDRGHTVVVEVVMADEHDIGRLGHVIVGETSLPLVTDPLGGSYYVENLTNVIEREAWKIIDEIEKMGGWLEAIRLGWVETQLEESAYRHQKEIEDKERLAVGVNAFKSPPEEDMVPGGLQKLPPPTEPETIARLKRFKEQRDMMKLTAAMKKLYLKVQSGENLVPPTVEAVKSQSTLEEIMSTIRDAWGYSPDPYDARDNSRLFETN